MELLRCKTRIAVLWLIQAIGMSAVMILFFMEPGFIEDIMTGEILGMEIGEGVIFWLAIFWFIPWIMAWLSMTLKASTNRWISFVLGILFAIYLIIGLIAQSAEGRYVALLVGYFLGAVAGALIAWYAWKLPKEEKIKD